MSLEKILNGTSILKNQKLELDGVELIRDDVLSLEFHQDFFEFGITGSLKIKDTFDFNNSGLVTLNGDNQLVVSLTDFLGNKSKRTYRVIDTVVTPVQERFKVFEFVLIDEITFQLSNTFISKSFHDTPVNALKQYFTELKIDDLLTTDNMKYDIIDTTSVADFVVPQNVSVLEFFVERLKLENVRMYQDRYGVHVKEVVPSKLKVLQDGKGKDILYSNDTLNNEYVYKIHDFQENKNRTGVTNSEFPKTTFYRHSTDKSIQDKSVDLSQEVDNFKLNTLDATKMQLTTGFKYNTQSSTSTLSQTYQLFDVMMSNNSMQIAVNSDMLSSNIGNVANIEFRGNIVSADTTQKGDVMTSGMYFIGGVKDRIFGDKLIHKLMLVRLDAKKPR